MPRFYPSECDFTRRHQVSQVPTKGHIPNIWEGLGQDAPLFILLPACPFLRQAPTATLELPAPPQPELSSSGAGLMLSPRWVGISLPQQNTDLEIHNASVLAVTV